MLPIFTAAFYLQLSFFNAWRKKKKKTQHHPEQNWLILIDILNLPVRPSGNPVSIKQYRITNNALFLVDLSKIFKAHHHKEWGVPRGRAQEESTFIGFFLLFLFPYERYYIWSCDYMQNYIQSAWPLLFSFLLTMLIIFSHDPCQFVRSNRWHNYRQHQH